ncbi:MAG TPA: hypothetical protein VIZ70_03775 [Propionibacteriaceae bacterium]|jgi:hypothetical protein
MSASQPSRHSARKERSLDLVQRMIISALVGVVFGTFAAALAAKLAVRGDEDLPPFSVTELWIMSGVLGLATAAAILLINRKRPIAHGCSSAPSGFRGITPTPIARFSIPLYLVIQAAFAIWTAVPILSTLTHSQLRRRHATGT